LSVGFNSFDPSLLFRRSISDACIEAIRSVTHPGLARGVERLTGSPIRTERKQAGRPGRLPSGSFLEYRFLNPGACSCQIAPRGAQHRCFGVQKSFSAGLCSFSFIRTLVGRAEGAAANPLLTHGTVKSLQNFCSLRGGGGRAFASSRMVIHHLANSLAEFLYYFLDFLTCRPKLR
jgi:hypothetical protein